MMENMGIYGGWGMGLGWIIMVLFWVLLIAGIVAFAKWILGVSSGNPMSPDKSAIDLLKERYARGEIEKEEFEQKRQDLKS